MRVGPAVVLFLVPALAVAQGCGPTRLKVTEHIMLDMPPARAWALIGNFQDLSWNATTISTVGAGGNEPDKAVRTVTLNGGAIIGESLYKYDAAAMSYSYHIDTLDVSLLPVQNVSATIEIVPQDGGAKSLVQWRAAFYRYLAPDEPSPDTADANAAKAMTSILKQGLSGLSKRTDPKT